MTSIKSNKYNMEKKIIDLGILPELELSGVKKISLVEEPAIELDFLYFKKENFVTPSAGESKDNFISRCIGVVVNEGKNADQAAAICYSYWDSKFEVMDLDIFGYKPSNFDICPVASALFKHLTQMTVTEDVIGMIRSAALQTDKIFEIEKTVIAKGIATKEDLKQAVILANDFIDLMQEIDALVGMQHDVSWIEGHIMAIYQYLPPNEFNLDDACWKGYEPIGVKKKNGRTVPNCVPIKNGKFEIDTTGLTPYVDQEGPKKKIDDLLTPEQLETILEMASVLGVHESEVDYVSAFQFALNPKDADYTPARTITKADGEEVVYKYRSSNVASNTRQFCSRMMGLSRFYTREEIDALDTFNEEFGPGVGGGRYSIFKYKGGVNCQHYWQKFIAQRVGRRLQVTEATPDDNIQRVAQTAPRATQGRGYVKRPQRNLAPLAGNSAFSKLQFNFADEEQKIVVGPAMLPNISIPRKDEETGDIYYVKFSEETIKEIAMKYMKEARTNETNTDHEVNQAGAYVFESWLVEDPKTDKANTVYGYNVPKGTWMVKMKVDDKETWRRIKNGELKGFSVEGSFSDMEEIEDRRRYEKILNILK
jgi:hypothetical protein